MTLIHMTRYLHPGSYDNNNYNNNGGTQELKIIYILLRTDPFTPIYNYTLYTISYHHFSFDDYVSQDLKHRNF